MFDNFLEDKKLQGQEIRAEAERKKELRLIDQQRKIPGLTLWKYHELECTLEKAKFKKTDVWLGTLDPKQIHLLKFSNRIEVESDCYYFQALNRTSAVRHLSKRGKKIKFK